jgi:hypothetical protein
MNYIILIILAFIILALVTFGIFFLIKNKIISSRDMYMNNIISNNSKRMVTYWEGWGNTVYGTPQNYTHMIFAFAVPYHYWGGYCSGLCTPWVSVDSGTLQEAIQMVKTIKQQNPKIKEQIANVKMLSNWSLENEPTEDEVSENLHN